jgi:hypothetical protein
MGISSALAAIDLTATAGAAGTAAGGLATIGTAASVLGAGVGAVGSIEQGEATSAADKYNAQIAKANAQIATQSANYAGAAGMAQSEQAGLQSRSKLGAIVANEGASGVDTNSGSNLQVQSSARELGELNAITIRSNAARTAYGYQVQGANDTAQSQLDTFQSNNATISGDIGAASSVLGGLGSAASNYAKFTMNGGGSGLNSGSVAPTVDSSFGTVGSGSAYPNQ